MYNFNYSVQYIAGPYYRSQISDRGVGGEEQRGGNRKYFVNL